MRGMLYGDDTLPLPVVSSWFAALLLLFKMGCFSSSEFLSGVFGVCV